MIHHCLQFTSLKSLDLLEHQLRLEKVKKIKLQKKAKLAVAAKNAQQVIGLETEYTVLANTKQIMDAKYIGKSNNNKLMFKLDYKTTLYIKPVKAIQAIELIENTIYKLQGIIQIFADEKSVRRGGIKQLKVL